MAGCFTFSIALLSSFFCCGVLCLGIKLNIGMIEILTSILQIFPL